MINFSTNSNTFNPLANLKVSVKNADSKGTNSSILNSSQNTNSTQSINSSTNSQISSSNSSTTNPQSATNSIQNSNFVKDKSQATSEILGYGVDNDGFFTSDFNEAVGLDKDYKIYAKGVENLAQELATNKHFSQIELTKTLGNVYKLFSQLVPNAQTYDKEQISQIPLGFDYDTKNLTITQKHSSQNELSKGVSANDSPLSRTQTA